MVQNDAHLTGIIFLEGPGFVDVADLACFIFGVHQPLNRGGVAVQAHHGPVEPGFLPGAAFAGDRVGHISDGETGIIKLVVTADEVRERSFAVGAEGGVAVGPGGFERHGTEPIAVGDIDHIAGQRFRRIKPLLFVGLADAHQGIGPAFVGVTDLLLAEEVVVINKFCGETTALLGSLLRWIQWIDLFNQETVCCVGVEHGVEMERYRTTPCRCVLLPGNSLV